MTRIKKLLLAGSMAVVTCCVSLSPSILNVSSLFARVKVNADTVVTPKESTTPDFNNNTHDEATTQNGKVITVSNIPSSAQKGGSVYIPRTVMSSTVSATDGTVSNATAETSPTIIIKNPYGVNLLNDDGTIKDVTAEGSDLGSNPVKELELVDASHADNSTHPNTFKFTPAQIGTYTVQYAVQHNGVWTSSNIYNINVSAEQFSIEFITNDPIVMPDKIDTNQNLTDEDKSINIALPIFNNGKGDQIKNFVLETDKSAEEDATYYIVADYVTLNNVFLDNNNSPRSVSKNPADAEGKNVYEEYSTYQIRKLTKDAFETENINDKYKYSVAINTKVSTKPAKSNNGNLTPENIFTIEQLHGNLNFYDSANDSTTYNYIDYAYNFVAGNGLNFIDYRLYETDNADSSTVQMPLSSVSKSIDGSVSNKRDNINVGVSVSSNLRSSAVSVGKKTYLPAVTTVDKNANRNSIPAYYYYKIAFVDSKDKLVYDDTSKFVMGIDDGGLYFIPKATGSFNIYYNAQDFYYSKVSKKDGHTDSFADDYDYDVTVADRIAPDLYLTDTYTFENLTKTKENDEDTNIYGEDLKKYLRENDYSYTIPTKYNIVKGDNVEDYTKIIIPAIFTEDNFKEFSELRIFRTISSSDGFKIDGETQSNFKIDIQDGSSSNKTQLSPESAANKVNIFLDDIVKFEFGDNLPTDVYYKQGNFYKKPETPKEVDENTKKSLHLAVDGDRVYITKEDADGGVIEDKSKRADGKYYTDGTNIYEATLVNDYALIKKWKTSSKAVITINPNLFSAGEYTVEFRIQDGSGNSNNTGDKFKFTLVEDTTKEDLDKEAPEVKFTTATTIGNVGENEKISIAKPRVTDDVDNRIYTKYYVEANGKYKEIGLDDNNKLTFNTSDKIGDKTIYQLATESTTNKAIRVIAIAYDDFADIKNNPIDKTDFVLDDTLKDAHIGYAIYSISISYINDEFAPVITKKLTITGLDEKGFSQGDKVLINGIKYVDNTQNAKIRTIKVVDSKGNVCASQSLVYEEDENGNVIGDFKSVVEKRLASGETLDKIKKDLRSSTLTTISKLTSAPSGLDSSYLYEYNFPGISFIATESDNYTITYELCDEGTNNITVLTFVTTKAADTEAPVIDGVVNAGNDLELGETYFITSIKVTDNGKDDISKVKMYWNVKGAKLGPQNHYLNKLDDGTFVFTPQAVDVYTITLTAIDENNNSSSKSFVVTVKDTNKPTIELSKQYPTNQYGEYAGTKITIDEKAGDADPDNNVEAGTNKDGVKIKWSDNKLPSVNLPGFSAQDVYQEKQFASLGANGKITIKTPDDTTFTIDSKGNVTGGQNEIKLEMKSEGSVNYFAFTPTKRGHYTATYSATDLNNNESDSTKNPVIDIYIGDTERPVIYLTDNLANKLNKGFVVGENAELTINPDARISGQNNFKSQDLYVEDNYGFNVRTSGSDGNKYEYVTVSVSVTNEKNSTIRQEDSKGDGMVRYKFDTAGTYTITFTVTDDCGNTGTFTRQFTVTKDKATSMDTTKIVGIVLIVVSVLILGGVVIYFVKGTKFLPKRKKNTNAKKEKSEQPDNKQE